MQTKQEELEATVEHALAQYLDIKPGEFMGTEWSHVARDFALCVAKTQTLGEGYWASKDAAKELTTALGDLSHALAAVVD